MFFVCLFLCLSFLSWLIGALFNFVRVLIAGKREELSSGVNRWDRDDQIDKEPFTGMMPMIRVCKLLTG